jgi:hypothetical protein
MTDAALTLMSPASPKRVLPVLNADTSPLAGSQPLMRTLSPAHTSAAAQADGAGGRDPNVRAAAIAVGAAIDNTGVAEADVIGEYVDLPTICAGTPRGDRGAGTHDELAGMNPDVAAAFGIGGQS